MFVLFNQPDWVRVGLLCHIYAIPFAFFGGFNYPYQMIYEDRIWFGLQVATAHFVLAHGLHHAWHDIPSHLVAQNNTNKEEQ